MEGIEKVKQRIIEIINDHQNSKKYLEGEDDEEIQLEYIRGKIEAYSNCLQLIQAYVT